MNRDIEGLIPLTIYEENINRVLNMEFSSIVRLLFFLSLSANCYNEKIHSKDLQKIRVLPKNSMILNFE